MHHLGPASTDPAVPGGSVHSPPPEEGIWDTLWSEDNGLARLSVTVVWKLWVRQGTGCEAMVRGVHL